MKLFHVCLSVFLFASAAAAQEAKSRLIEEPSAFKTLVNPMCSHCKDEAKRRSKDLKADDRVLCWIRGYSEGGVIPQRFFLNPYRVISDTYGIFVHDPDAGYARGFEPSLEFQFHGWKNGVMVMKHKDGTLYSCLTGIAFDGPKKGEKLRAVPTLVSDWGHWLDTYPQAVAYHMFDKYQPVELPAKASEGSLKSRGPDDKRLAADAKVFGVAVGNEARAYPLDLLADKRVIHDRIDGKPIVVMWLETTKTAAAYRPIASAPGKSKDKPLAVTLEKVTYATKPMSNPGKGGFARPHPNAALYNRTAPFRDAETGSHWDIAGRAIDGELKGWTLDWLDGVEVKWFAWAAEYPQTTIHEAKEKVDAKDALKEIAGTSEFLRAVPKKFARLRDVDMKKHTVTLRIEGEEKDSTWPLTPDAEVKCSGWWGRPSQLNGRVWAWFHVDRDKKPVAIFMLADDVSEQDIHGGGYLVKSADKEKIVLKPYLGKDIELGTANVTIRRKGQLEASKAPAKIGERLYLREAGGWLLLDAESFEKMRAEQRKTLESHWWGKTGLPGTVGQVSVYTGEADILIDHEGMRWARSLKPGDKVELAVDPAIRAVVKSTAPLREKTQVRVVAKTFDLTALNPGKRIHFHMMPPDKDVFADPLPPDVDRKGTKEERVDWFLASIYCTCKVGGDGCTGHFYTLASCNPNACAAPNQTRKYIAKKIDDGWSNREIFEAMLKERGPQMLRPHLLP